jgi:hypothetical protein
MHPFVAQGDVLISQGQALSRSWSTASGGFEDTKMHLLADRLGLAHDGLLRAFESLQVEGARFVALLDRNEDELGR